MTEPSASSNSPFLPGEQPPAPEPAGEVAAPEISGGEQGAADVFSAAAAADQPTADEPPAEAPAALAADAGPAPTWQSVPEPTVQLEPVVQPESIGDSERFPLPLMSAPANSEAGSQAAPGEAPLSTPVAATVAASAAAPVAAAASGSEAPAEEPPAAPKPTAQPTAEPAVAATVHVPAAPATAEGGGEWDLLVTKLREWIGSGRLQDMLVQYQAPLRAVALLLALVLVLRLYGAVIGAIDSLPLLPGLLELAGVIWLSRFAASRLVRSSDRQQLIASLEQRWRAFRGND
ncbi:hypothetical protein KBY97_04675 [Synechococcus sp. ATX 2A4]|uniref:CAAD domain-containing protein n=1 Tax=Synechococcus sp. ATX 2A4 TaxID=2823727 RepID=UPI0020CD8630|nr:CAAD domain-containing protein [Synechococcus sp. ATX 2A4]MCP9884423.1 hypothetical protein [Synechococcus sp. ATX 2A4]